MGRTVRDLVIVGPCLFAAAVALFGVSDASHRGMAHLADHMAFFAAVAVVLLVWYRWRSASAERLRALELGFDPGRREGWTPLRVAVYVGLGAPLGTAFLALVASLAGGDRLAAAWYVAGLLGSVSLVCTTVLLSRLPFSAFRSPDERFEASAGKPGAVDPDAYDVAGRRG